ncbi:MAG: type ISP restriction/modification enzyme [Pseudomonadota bacterium]
MTSPFETFFSRIATIRATSAGTAETSYYSALQEALNLIGAKLKPKVFCIAQLEDQGAGHPDFGLYAQNQLHKASARKALPAGLPERGAIEMKPVADDIAATLRSKQVNDYFTRYGLLLVTNLRSFVLIGRDHLGNRVTLESFDFGLEPEKFFALAAARRTADDRLKTRFVEFLQRVLLHNAALAQPRDVAWFLGSYARDALARISGSDLPALAALRKALEEALGLKFEGEKGDHFFRSTLIQTLFYGVFSAWVIWSKEQPPGANGRFDWHAAEWSLHVPMIRTLFEQVATPTKLKPLDLVEVLDWTAATLNRVDRAAFFEKFEEGFAIQYFYEPFLEAFDPELRKQLGVWYTPPEIVTYMVERVDRVLRAELGLADGLADANVYVLDPCCGTGSYLVEVLKRIERTLRERGEDALLGEDLKRAATSRVFGFEIMPAPFVIAHWQIGTLLRNAGTVFEDAKNERAMVFLTNALTGWEPPTEPKTALPFPEFQEERDAAEHVKRDVPILVILGNPPYNAYAGTSPAEEAGLVEPFKEGLIKTWGIKKFNLDDLYIRFFRVAERRIAEKTGKGVVCFISNHSWIAEPSFVVMREHLLNNFDRFWIENMHGNRKISEYAPDGRTSETIFAIAGFSPGIQQGVAISLWVKSGTKPERPRVLFRDDLHEAKAADRRRQLFASLDDENASEHYVGVEPTAANRFSFRPSEISPTYQVWPRLTELCEMAPINGLMEKRGGALIDIDRDALERRMRGFFDPRISFGELKAISTQLTSKAAGYDPEKVRAKGIDIVVFTPDRLVRYAVRPLDTRWAYYSPVSSLWNRNRPTLWAQTWKASRSEFLMVRPAQVASAEGVPMCYTRLLGDNDALRGHAYYLPFRLKISEAEPGAKQREMFTAKANAAARVKANLSPAARAYLAALNLGDPDKDPEVAALVWFHALAIGYAPAYLAEHADGIRQDWPRIPLPASAARLQASARLGAEIARLIDTELPVAGVTAGTVRPELKTIGAIARVGGGRLRPADLGITARWGHAGKAGVTMPGKGKLVVRDYALDEAPPPAARGALGPLTCDVYLNDEVLWRNVPARVWDYTIGGYQVIKKWLSYRELSLLGRPLTVEEAREVTNMARRLAALRLLEADLDANYQATVERTAALPTRA